MLLRERNWRRNHWQALFILANHFQNLRATFGSEPKIQLNDAFKEVDDIQDFIAQEREQLDETERTKMLVSLKIDKETKMGIVVDVKQALRRANALKIMYANTNVDETKIRLFN